MAVPVLVKMYIGRENDPWEIYGQSGVAIGPHILTVSNKIFRPVKGDKVQLKAIEVLFPNKFSECCKQPVYISAIWKSSEVEDIFRQYFSNDNENYEESEELSYFVLLTIQNVLMKPVVLGTVSHHIEPFVNLVTGMDISVVHSAFASVTLLNCETQGIISHIYGNNRTMFLTDAPLTPGCEGAPLFRPSTLRSMVGLIICNIPFYNGSKLEESPFHMGVSIVPILNSLNTHLKFLSNIPPNISSFFEFKCFSAVSQMDILSSDYIVAIKCGISQGTGFIVHEDGLIMTCAHVVCYSRGVQVEVTFQNKDIYTGSVVFASSVDSNIDVALIQVDSPTKFSKCKLASAPPVKGECVYLLGYSLFLQTFIFFMSKGVISQCSPEGIIMTSCTTLEGASGGVIARRNGEVVALVSSYITTNNQLFKKVKYHRNSCSYSLSNLYPPLLKYIATKDPVFLEELLIMTNTKTANITNKL